MYNSSIDFIMLWRELSFSYRVFVLILIAVTVHSLISAIVVVKRLRQLRTLETTDSTLVSLNSRCDRLRQTLGATVYLFVFLMFVGLQSARHTLGLSHAALVDQILRNFELHFIFAAKVFLVFLILHLLQWVLSSRVQAFARHRKLAHL